MPRVKLVVVEHFRGREAGVDLDTERFGLRAEPAHRRTERADEIAVIVHQLGQWPVGQRDAARGPQHEEMILGDHRLQRTLGILPPVGQQAIESDGIDDGARQNMRANRRALLDDDDGDFGVDLLQANRGGQAGGTCADDHDVIFHRVPGGQFGLVSHYPLPAAPVPAPRVSPALIAEPRRRRQAMAPLLYRM